MKNGIFKMDWASIMDAVLTGAGAAVAVAVYGMVTTPGFDLFAVDWAVTGKMMLNLAVVAGAVSLSKDFLSTKQGSLLGVGPTN